MTTLHRQPAEEDGKEIVVFHIRAVDASMDRTETD